MRRFAVMMGSTLLGVWGCGVSSSEVASVTTAPTPPLTSRDLAPLLAPNPINADQVPGNLSYISELYANFPSDPGPHSKEPCEDLIFSQPVYAKGNTLIWSYSADLSTCSGVSRFGTNVSTSYTQLVCTGGDVSAADGKPWRDIITNKWTCTSLSTLSEGIQDFSVEIGGAKTKQRNVTYSGTADLQPCQAPAEDQPYADGCLVLSTTLNSTSIHNQVNTTSAYTKLEFRGIRSDNSQSAPWYNSGEINVTLSDWQGTLTYSNARVAPTYQLTNTSGQKISGQLQAYKPSGMN